MADVVVVGAGVGGLATAARLATAGHRVTVVERDDAVGGKLGLAVLDGHRFDTGPSLLTLPQVFAELFAATGAPLQSVLELAPVEPVARYRFADGTRLDAPAGTERFAAAVEEALAPGSGADWLRLVARAERMWRASRGPFLQRPLSPAVLASAAARRPRDLAAIAPTRTLRGLGRGLLRDPRLRRYLERYATYSGSDPRRAPAVLATIPYVEQRHGGWYVQGGLYRLGEALAGRARERGAVLRRGTGVRRIAVGGGRRAQVRGVVLDDGRRLAADVVVCNADAARVYGALLPAGVARRARVRLASSTPSLAGFVLLLAVRGRTPGLAHHNVLFSDDYDAEFDAIFGADARPVPDPTLYVSVPDDRAVAPTGDESWFVLVNAPRQGPVDWTPDVVTRYADRLLDLLAARGLDVRGRVKHRLALSPADLERRTGAPGGAIYGTASNSPLAAFLRPANRSPVRGLFLVGGSSHPGGGLPLVALSARIVAGQVGRA